MHDFFEKADQRLTDDLEEPAYLKELGRRKVINHARKEENNVDRILPITAFMYFLNKSLPMPFGSQLMDLAGVVVAGLLGIYNGYALLIYETITIKKGYPPRYSSRDQCITDIIHKYHLLHRQAEILVDWDNQQQQRKLNKTIKFFKQKQLMEQLNPLGYQINKYKK